MIRIKDQKLIYGDAAVAFLSVGTKKKQTVKLNIKVEINKKNYILLSSLVSSMVS